MCATIISFGVFQYVILVIIVSEFYTPIKQALNANKQLSQILMQTVKKDIHVYFNCLFVVLSPYRN